MKKTRKIVILFSLILIVSSCSVSERTIIPQYVTVEKLNSLQNGMSKTEVANKMEIAPFDAYHSLENGCELYSYKYVLNDQKIRPEDVDKKSGLRGGEDYFNQPKDVYLYFENNKLVDLITGLGIEYGTSVDDFGKSLESLCAGPISGCTDVEALNYDKNASLDNGSCKYCPCDQIKNPNYDPKRKCGDQCIPINQPQDKVDDDCSICDIVKNAGANTTINVTTVAPWENAKESSSTANSKTKANDEKLIGVDKRLASVEKALAKSKENDLKKGKVSKKTKILQKSLDKLQTTKK